MTHKLVTPLNSLKNTIKSSQLLAESQNYLNIKEGMEKCLISINIIEYLLENIKDLTLSFKRTIPLQNQAFNIHQNISDIISLFIDQSRAKGVNLSYKVHPLVPMYIWGDPQRLNQLLFTLISNAMKYTNKGDIKIHVKVKTINNQNVLLLAIKDDGCGIKEEILQNIFNFQLNLNSKEDVNNQGIGLGLTLCRKIITAMGGQIDCFSKVNIGTKFIIEIPIQIQDQTESTEQQIIQKEGNSEDDYQRLQSYDLQPKLLSYLNNQSNYSKILIVDDDSFNRQALEELIKLQGNFEITQANDGKQAVDEVCKLYAENKHFAVIIMDLNMPGMNGKQAVEQIRKYHQEGQLNLDNTKIYLHSCIPDTVEVDYLFDGILKKPVNFKQLELLLQSLI